MRRKAYNQRTHLSQDETELRRTLLWRRFEKQDTTHESHHTTSNLILSHAPT
jgi:hypothetical protein